MKSLFSGLVLSLTASVAFSASAAPAITNASKQKQMLSALDFIQDVYQSNYAPAEWKTRYLGWSLEDEINQAKAKVQASPDMTVSEYQKVLKEFFQSTKDYHVSVGFYGTESSSLPLSVMGAEGRYFLAWIDRDKLPEDSFPFQVGDELVSMDSKPTGELVETIRIKRDTGVQLTDRALSELALTSRRAKSFNGPVPQGSTMLEIKRQKDQKIVRHQLVWDYKPETVPDFKFQAQIPSLLSPSQRLAKLEMTSLPAKEMMAQANYNPFMIGGRRSYLPALGEKIWESDPKSIFDAYVYKNPQGKMIGYVRIPNYVCQIVDEGRVEQKNAAECLTEFAGLMAKFQKITDGLVIDQLNNPGGSVFYLYALASTLTDQPLYTPLHRFTVNQESVQESLSLLATLAPIKNEEEAKKAMGENLAGYPVTYQMVQYMRDFSNFVISEYKAGRQLTTPHFLWGVDQINPHPTSRYTKPVLLLVNSLDFSGGDFFPAILQDNQRVRVMGARTAGAGGYIQMVQFPNILGISGFSFTGSIAERINKNPIENLGVTPDVPYALTANDLQNGFVDYTKAIQAELSNLVK